MSAAATLLDRLDGVRQTGPGRWLARCPAHEDRSPSLSIRELDDGRLLLHDFGGCDTEAVLDSLGLEMQALFPERLAGSGPASGHTSTHSRVPPRDLLEIISEEVSVVSIIATDFCAKLSISEQDWERLATAASRIHRARDYYYAH
ncbi:MAG TPA: hypothetical protein VFX20_15510 [Steroidobacteraceae bacterium]|nr:hypothetical protein [Steroidobacteraceae bacterium]